MSAIYKICSVSEWSDAKAAGLYSGSPDDLRDGFIHFSTAAQLEGTLARHFAARDDLVLIAFESEDHGDALRWEPSRGGDLFPHLYGSLDPTLARHCHEITLDSDGRHLLPKQSE